MRFSYNVGDPMRVYARFSAAFRHFSMAEQVPAAPGKHEVRS